MADYEQIMKALRNAHAAGDTSAATRLAAMARAAKGVATQAETPAKAGAVPGGFELGTGELQTNGPGPSGSIDPELYKMGAIGRRFAPGELQRPDMTTVKAGDGTEMVLNPATGQYTSRELMAGNMRPGVGQAFQAGAAQGFTLGAGDEVAGALMGPFAREKARAALDASRRDRPGVTLTGELSGALSLPAKAMGPTGTLGEAVRTGAKAGAVYGGGYAAASADGGVLPRIKAGIEGAVAGSIFGAATPIAVNFGTKAFRKMFQASSKRPTLESLRTTRDAAYHAVDSAGEKFGPDELRSMAERARTGLDDFNYLPEADPQTTGVLRQMEGLGDRELTLGQLDKFRQSIWKRYNKSQEEGLLEVIEAIDDTITSRASTSELLDAARLSHARYKKAELLDLAFKKADRQTAATGSGGNVMNKYRQAVTSVLNNPRQAKWFSGEERAAMEAFIAGSTTQNAMRLVGKLSPGGNGLMTALNLGAVAAEPGMLAVSVLAGATKAAADRSTMRQAEGLIGKVGGGNVPIPARPVTYPARTNALAGPIMDAMRD